MSNLFRRNLRKAIGATLAEVAKEAGFSVGQIHRWEVGYTCPDKEKLDKWDQAMLRIDAKRRKKVADVKELG